jgi:hypothetical protein
MKKLFLLAAPALLLLQARPLATVTLTGWFSDERCAPARLTVAKLGPSNPDCSETCIKNGAAAVFISESGREILKIKNHPKVIDDLGYHVEVTGALDRESHTLTVQSVKQLSYEGAACARPRKPVTAKQNF